MTQSGETFQQLLCNESMRPPSASRPPRPTLWQDTLHITEHTRHPPALMQLNNIRGDYSIGETGDASPKNFAWGTETQVSPSKQLLLLVNKNYTFFHFVYYVVY